MFLLGPIFSHAGKCCGGCVGAAVKSPLGNLEATLLTSTSSLEPLTHMHDPKAYSRKYLVSSRWDVIGCLQK